MCIVATAAAILSVTPPSQFVVARSLSLSPLLHVHAFWPLLLLAMAVVRVLLLVLLVLQAVLTAVQGREELSQHAP